MIKHEKKLKASEAAKYLGIDSSLLAALCRNNKGPRHTYGYNGSRFIKSDLDEWARSVPQGTTLKSWLNEV